jgi:hypothetical protein
MTTVKRWLEIGSEATALERELLGAASHFDPPSGAESRVWAALVGLLPPVGGGAGPAPTPGGGSLPPPAIVGASAGAKLAVTKTVLTTLVVGVAGFGTVLAIDHDRPEPTQLATSIPPESRTPPPALSLAAPIPTPSVERPAAPGRAPERVAAPAPSSPASVAAFPVAGPAPTASFSDLRDENRLLRSAREALRAGDCARALEQLDAARAAFPSGELEQEREVLAIRALVAAGRRLEARDRARAFLDRHPSSPLAGRIAALLRESE